MTKSLPRPEVLLVASVWVPAPITLQARVKEGKWPRALQVGMSMGSAWENGARRRPRAPADPGSDRQGSVSLLAYFLNTAVPLLMPIFMEGIGGLRGGG